MCVCLCNLIINIYIALFFAITQSAVFIFDSVLASIPARTLNASLDQ